MFGVADLHLWNIMLKNIVQTNITSGVDIEPMGTRFQILFPITVSKLHVFSSKIQWVREIERER